MKKNIWGSIKKTIKLTSLLTLAFILSLSLAACGDDVSVTVNGADPSIAVIGGADGPTEIFLGGDDKTATEPQSTSFEYDDNNERIIDANDYLVVVNREYGVGSTYEPDDLEVVTYYTENSLENRRKLRHEARVAYDSMIEAAENDGYSIRLISGYRSYDLQKQLYEKYVARDGQEAADKYSAKPGTSEHQTGLAVDLSAASASWDLTSSFGSTAEGKWLAAHAAEYGFILRYPDGKEDVTGYMYEPWHFRYVGLDAARAITDAGLTLEEYLGL